MSITTYNNNYYDDYVAAGNSDKNYLRILFKPGYSVQVRELNQLQSALQDQINRLGSSVWKKDTAVIGGKASFLPNVYSIQLNLATITSAYTAAYIASNAKTLRYLNLNGEVLGAELVTGSTYKFYYTYTSTGNSNAKSYPSTVQTFSIALRNEDSTVAPTVLTNATSIASSLGYAAAVVCESGVYFTKGSFVATPQQTLFVPKSTESTLLTGYALLKIDENVVSYFDDDSLLDNATGTPNYSAPGADRYQIDLSLAWLTTEGYTATTANEYVKLLYVNASRPEEISETSKYSEINDVLAKRTSEESGNYTVNPFPLQARELYDGDSLPVDCIVSGITYKIQSLTGTTEAQWIALGATSPQSVGQVFTAILTPTTAPTVVGTGLVSEVDYTYGTYTANNLNAAGYNIATTAAKKTAILDAKERYNITLGESVAYVDGYRVSLDRSINLNAPKARTTADFEAAVSANIGSYFIGNIQRANGASSTVPTLSTVTNTYNLYATPTVTTILASRTEGSTTLTVTANSHGLSNGDIIFITSSADATIPLALYTVSAVATNTFTVITTGNTTVLTSVALTFLLATGTCKIRAFESTGVTSTEYRCFVYDVVFNTTTSTADWSARRFDNIDQIAGNNFRYTVTSANLLQQSNNTNIFPLPYDAVKDLASIKYYAQQLYTGTVSGAAPNCTITINAGTGKTFQSSDTLIVLVDGTPTTYSVSSANTATITIANAAWTAAQTYSVIAPVQITDANTSALVTKTITEGSHTIAAGTNNITADEVLYLDKPDVIRIKSVVRAGVNITSQFVLFDDGQRDTYYTNARIRYTGATAITSSNVVITYEYYARPAGLESKDLVVYTTDSYVGIPYEDIPTYAGIKLADAFDFRQDLVYSVTNGILGSIVANTGKSVIDPNTAITATATVYLPRVDKVIVNSQGRFSILQGVPALAPVEPSSPKNSMTLYSLDIPAYTSSITDIVPNYIDNRRYTMRDIGAIDKRVSNVEYYTSLSLLERSAADKPIFDDAGERFKNGILVDNFIGHGIGDVFNPSYSCAVDRITNTLRPRYNTHNVDLIISSAITTTGTIKTVDSSKIRVHDSLVTLDYSEALLVSHIKATGHISVHPHIYAKVSGAISLYPSVDHWKDTVSRPSLIVQDDSSFDAIKFIAEDPALDILGTDWNNWQVEWRGVSTNVTRKKVKGRVRIDTAVTTTVASSRTGTLTTLSSTNIAKSLGETVVGTSIIPFIRSRRVLFHATGLKSNTVVYPFFDDRDISLYTNKMINGPTTFVPPTTPSNNITQRFDGLIPSTLPSAGGEYGSYGAELKTDATGQIYGSFIIPNNDTLRFSTGERIFKLTDDIANGGSETSFAFSKYSATGILETVQETILSTKTPQFNVTPTSERTVNSVTNVRTRYKDPIAQSFLINSEEYPEGVFITSVDLYFQRKAENADVEVYVVTMENGAPTRTIVPYSRVSKPSADVAVSANSSALTKFTFSDPVYLKPDEEYALVVSSNDSDYRCWYATLGEVDVLTNKRIEQQEYLGTFFTSANAFTWTPQQEQDLKFSIHRAIFESASGAVGFKTELHTGVERINITSGGSGYTSVPTVVITPIGGNTPTITTTAVAILNPFTGAISGVRVTRRGSGYTGTPTISFTATGGDTPTAATATASLANVPVSLFNISQPSIAFASSTLNYTVNFNSAGGIAVEPDINVYLPSSYGASGAHILAAQTAPSTEPAKTAIVTATLATLNTAVSPVIDMDGGSLLAVTNLINNSVSNETLANNGASVARYITRRVDLNDPADRINIYIGCNRPTADTNIRVYAKFGYDTSTQFDSVPWVEINPTNPIAINSDTETYSESEFIADPNDDFVSFQIKVVLLSANIFDVPTIRDFRAIATV
jgi:hypothetical protein